MRDEIIRFKDIIGVIRRNLILAGVIMFICLAVAFAASKKVKKQFRSRATLSIQNSYFQVPLVDDLIAPIHEASEMRSQREALLRYALSEEFVDGLAEKYQVYQFPAGHPTRNLERELFMRRIQYLSTAPTTFMLTATANDPLIAQEMTQAVLDQIILTLVSERINQLYRAKNAIRSNLESLKYTLSGKKGSPTQATLMALQDELAALEKRFSPQHPSVIRQRMRVEQTRRQAEGGNRREDPEKKEFDKANFVASGSKQAMEALYDDLVRKLNYVNIALEMEQDKSSVPYYLNILENPAIPPAPFFPSKKGFLGMGAAIGMILSILLAIYRELRKGSFLSPVMASSLLGAPLMGALPKFDNNKGEKRKKTESETNLQPQVAMRGT